MEFLADVLLSITLLLLVCLIGNEVVKLWNSVDAENKPKKRKEPLTIEETREELWTVYMGLENKWI